jgi:hypothetical protein
VVVLRRVGLERCPYCLDEEVYRSRSEPLTLLDRLCMLFFLQLVMCHQCERRHYRPVFFSAPEYPRRALEQKSARTAFQDSAPRKRRES